LLCWIFLNNKHTFLIVKRYCPNFFGFFNNFSKMALNRPGARYEAELSGAALVAFFLVDDFGLSDAFE
jgi:hypothetical protein